MPDKSEKSYTKLFKMLQGSININPDSIKSDLELAIVNAAQKVFKCKISCCFFHLSQSIMKNIQQNGLLVDVYKSDKFRQCNNLLKSIAFVPVDDVVRAFEMVKNYSNVKCPNFNTIIEYFERNYIGLLKNNSKTVRSSPRFNVEYWNLFDREKLKLARTTNVVESWHSRISTSNNKHIGLDALIDVLLLEQSNAENDLMRLSLGNHSEKRSTKDERIYNLVNSYNEEDLFESLNNIALCLND